MAAPMPIDTGIPPPSLYQYMLQTQRFLADTSQTYVNPLDITDYVNRARREVAMRTQSVRVKPPIQGQITQLSIASGGDGYISPVVLISDCCVCTTSLTSTSFPCHA